MFTKKYRNTELEDMVGSLNVRTTLTKLIDSQSLPNSIIISGENGLGKTTIGYILAYKTMCGCGSPTCELCTEIKEQLWDYKPKPLTGVYEYDLGKNSKEEYIDNLMSVFMQAGKKVILIDEIQNIDPRYMDKFLKTIERIEKDTYVIFTTTELNKINLGIVSRSEVFELTPPTTTDLCSLLETICSLEGVRFNRQGLYALAKIKYRVRDAVNSLETITNTYGEVNLENVREYFGKFDYSYVIKFLKSTKESSPYEMLYLLQEIKEQIGLAKFSESLKETLLDSIYSRYKIKPAFLTENEMTTLAEVAYLFSSEELSHMLEVVERLPHRSNIDKEVMLVNLGFLLSNGKLLKKTGSVEESKVVANNSPQLKEDVMLGNSNEINTQKGFTVLTDGELPYFEEDKEKSDLKIGEVIDLGGGKISNSQFLKNIYGGD